MISNFTQKNIAVIGAILSIAGIISLIMDFRIPSLLGTICTIILFYQAYDGKKWAFYLLLLCSGIGLVIFSIYIFAYTYIPPRTEHVLALVYLLLAYIIYILIRGLQESKQQQTPLFNNSGKANNSELNTDTKDLNQIISMASTENNILKISLISFIVLAALNVLSYLSFLSYGAELFYLLNPIEILFIISISISYWYARQNKQWSLVTLLVIHAYLGIYGLLMLPKFINHLDMRDAFHLLMYGIPSVALPFYAILTVYASIQQLIPQKQNETVSID